MVLEKNLLLTKKRTISFYTHMSLV